MNIIKTSTDYFRGAYQELKKVTWPTREETIRYSYLVIGISLGTAFLLGALDYVFNLGFEYLIGIK